MPFSWLIDVYKAVLCSWQLALSTTIIFAFLLTALQTLEPYSEPPCGLEAALYLAKLINVMGKTPRYLTV